MGCAGLSRTRPTRDSHSVMTFPTVTETTPRLQAVTPDPFIEPDHAEQADKRAREAAAVVPFLDALRAAA